jgi:hypothetical protein
MACSSIAGHKLMETDMKIPLNNPALERLIADYGLSIDGHWIRAGEDHRFVSQLHHESVRPPNIIPSIAGETDRGATIYFLVPSSLAPSSDRGSIDLHWFSPDDVSIPVSEYWPDDSEIQAAISTHWDNVFAARAHETLEQLRHPKLGLFASSLHIEDAPEMLIEGLLPDRGVSVMYGDFDEFKTTTISDMMAHVALGVPWQGRQVRPRPVAWYALEGKDELPLRLRALEARLKKRDPAWGDDRIPLTVFDRIPESYRAWRAELSRLHVQWEDYYDARSTLGSFPKTEKIDARDGTTFLAERYPKVDVMDGVAPVVVIDTLSLALGGEDEKGPKAVEFINHCLDLLKMQPAMEAPSSPDELATWEEDHPGETMFMNFPVASHVIIIHHQTKTGTDFAGHRAIGADSNALYRIHRYGSMSDRNRPLAGQITPMRVKGMPRPAPIRFEVEIAPVEGTKQTAAILKEKATEVPKRWSRLLQHCASWITATKSTGRASMSAWIPSPRIRIPTPSESSASEAAIS